MNEKRKQLKKNIQELEDIYENHYESFEKFVKSSLIWSEEQFMDPYNNEGLEEIQKEMFKNIVETYEEVKNQIIRDLIRETRELNKINQKISREISKYKYLLKQIQEAEIIRSGKQVAKDNIKQQLVLINLYEQDEILIDNYWTHFGINLSSMSQEEIDKIDLTSLCDGWW